MNIEWNITKKRGNFRPILQYRITLTEFEKQLGMPAVRIESSIPKPPDRGLTYCWPNHNERAAWVPSEYYLLMTPPHTKQETHESIKLPWRESNEYPEVGLSFAHLREAFEQVLARSAKSTPMEEQGSLAASAAAKSEIAPAAAAQRILQVVRR
ncbi:MAG: hypothetical protein D6E12_15630 [Desulfovibrio sp.]|nr:MAG: hypothetical protein D6E12_15630 [Desulfovibrio sp.]